MKYTSLLVNLPEKIDILRETIGLSQLGQRAEDFLFHVGIVQEKVNHIIPV